MKAIVGARLIDGTGGPSISNSTIIINNDKIESVWHTDQIEIPDIAERIYAPGMTLLPGLIDCHDHLAHFGHDLASRWGLNEPQSLRHGRIYSVLKETLFTGFTTVRDAAGLDAGFKHAIESGVMPGPRLQVALNFITPTGGQSDRTSPSGHPTSLIPQFDIPTGVADGPVAMRAKVREMVRAGADVIKTAVTGWGRPTKGLGPKDTIMRRDELEALVDEAHIMGRKVMCHVIGGQGLRLAVEVGVDSIEHGSYLNEDRDLFLMMADKGIYFIPTFSVFTHHAAKGTHHEKVQAIDMQDHHIESLQLALKEGVKVVAGSDAGAWIHGNNAHELSCLVKSGMAPMDAISASTGLAAECLGWGKIVGTIEAGKRADLILVDKDPIKDITSLEKGRSIRMVMKDGEVYLHRK